MEHDRAVGGWLESFWSALFQHVSAIFTSCLKIVRLPGSDGFGIAWMLSSNTRKIIRLWGVTFGWVWIILHWAMSKLFSNQPNLSETFKDLEPRKSYRSYRFGIERWTHVLNVISKYFENRHMYSIICSFVSPCHAPWYPCWSLSKRPGELRVLRPRPTGCEVLCSSEPTFQGGTAGDSTHSNGDDHRKTYRYPYQKKHNGWTAGLFGSFL